MGASRCPIPAIYSQVVAVLGYIGSKQPEQARAHLLGTWGIARHDDMIEGHGEHHGSLGAMMEAVISRMVKESRRLLPVICGLAIPLVCD